MMPSNLVNHGTASKIAAKLHLIKASNIIMLWVGEERERDRDGWRATYDGNHQHHHHQQSSRVQCELPPPTLRVAILISSGARIAKIIVCCCSSLLLLLHTSDAKMDAVQLQMQLLIH